MPQLDLNRPNLMAVINVTPDSFFDGGRHSGQAGVDISAVLSSVENALQAGADIIDIGGESTRPGATPVSEEEERQRVLPCVAAIRDTFPEAVLSIDTSSANVMLSAAEIGFELINDVRALTRPGALSAAAQVSKSVCLMHMQGAPATMQDLPRYDDVVSEVYDYLSVRRSACLAAGIAADKLIYDPGIGFGKKDEHNRALLKSLDMFSQLGPVLVGVSRKSMFGRLLDRPLDKRLAGSLAVAYHALHKGASILRVHDVDETKDLIRIFNWLNV